MDQAGTLRKLAADGPEGLQGERELPLAEPGRPRSRPPRVIAVSSGKGGVGKTNVVANVACALARLGRRVLILDADLGLANLDVLLGLAPRFTLAHVIAGEKTIEEILVPGPAGVEILPAASGVQELAELQEPQRLALLRELDRLDGGRYDLLLIDTAAGISSNVLTFSAAAQEILVVASPEPTSITDAYALMKVLAAKHRERHFRLLVNSAADPREGKEVYRKLSLAVDRFLHVSLDYAGYVLHDEYVPQAVRQQRLVVELYPYARASRCFLALARQVADRPAPSAPKGGLQIFWRQLATQAAEAPGGRGT
ncbi:MAG: MinD/ParA family protein [Deltaproteobacteria bacterium]|nr:MinD/ParA family protein [Deltaproteobacteria bacterium]